jgi:hypothetical protein
VDAGDSVRSEESLSRALPLAHMQVAWLLHAFATSRLAGPRDEGSVAALLRTLQGETAEPFAHLYLEWPELRAFVETHVGRGRVSIAVSAP